MSSFDGWLFAQYSTFTESSKTTTDTAPFLEDFAIFYLNSLCIWGEGVHLRMMEFRDTVGTFMLYFQFLC